MDDKNGLIEFRYRLSLGGLNADGNSTGIQERCSREVFDDFSSIRKEAWKYLEAKYQFPVDFPIPKNIGRKCFPLKQKINLEFFAGPPQHNIKKKI